MTILLAIEASQREGGVALRDAAGHVHVQPIGAARHDDELMPAIDAVVTRAGLSPRDLDAVGVSIGPGGFTGLRLAIAAAKMIGMTARASLVAVPSACVAAESCGPEAGVGPIMVALAVKRGSFWSTRLSRVRGGWCGDEGTLASEDDCPLDGLTAVVGDAHLPERIVARCGARTLPILPLRLNAEALLTASTAWLAAGRTVDPDGMLPLYPRLPEAVRRWSERSASP